MKAVINTWAKEPGAIYNGLTFDVVGHCNGHLEIEIDGIINDFELDEVIIVDIQNEMRHAAIRDEKTFCDYWYSILRKYVKENKISLSLKPVQLEKAISNVKEDNFAETAETEIESLPDEFIFHS